MSAVVKPQLPDLLGAAQANTAFPGSRCDRRHPTPTHHTTPLQKFLAWRSYEQSRVLEAERLLREYSYKHPTDQAAATTLELSHSEQGAGRGRRGPGPSAAAAAAAHGRPHLDRRTPVPPGGF